MSTRQEMATRPAQEIEAQLRVTPSFDNEADYAYLRKLATDFAASKLVPQRYYGNVPDCMIAIEMAHRLGLPKLMVMKELYVVKGNPGWSGQMVIALINTSPRFTALQYEYSGTGQSRACFAWAQLKESGKKIEGTTVSIQMAISEGWMANNPKWKNMPEQMLAYRSATFFVRIYAPELLMGLRTEEEIEDTEANQQAAVDERKARKAKPVAATVVETPATVIDALAGNAGPMIGHFQRIIQMELCNDVTFDDFRTFLERSKLMANTDSLTGWFDIPDDVAEKLAKDPAAMQKCAAEFGNL